MAHAFTGGMMKQRFYLNGKLQRTTKPATAEKCRKWLDNIEAHWRKGGLFPLTNPGEFDSNNAHTVERISLDELHITTTGGKYLRIVNIEVRE